MYTRETRFRNIHRTGADRFSDNRIRPERVKQARLRAGLTQAELSAAAGMSKSHISALENGARGISNPLLRQLARALNTTTFELC